MQATLAPTKQATTYTPNGAVSNFTYTGAVQSYIVPAGITALSVGLVGGYGAAGRNDGSSGAGGYPGKLSTVLPVTPGETLYIYVGGNASAHVGGWNGGGSAVQITGSVWGGVSAESVLDIPCDANRVVQAWGDSMTGSNSATLTVLGYWK